MEATVETSSGAVRRLAEWKRPTVLFYEDRDSTPVNQHVKDALYQRGREKGLLDSVAVVAVANVADFNWFPARNFVLAAVKDIEKKVNLPVYLDFRGSMTAPPWNLPAKDSTVLVLDAGGRPVLKLKGRLRQDEVDQVFDTLERLVAAASAESVSLTAVPTCATAPDASTGLAPR